MTDRDAGRRRRAHDRSATSVPPCPARRLVGHLPGPRRGVPLPALRDALDGPQGPGRAGLRSRRRCFPHAPALANFTRLASVQGLNVFGNVLNSVLVTLGATVLARWCSRPWPATPSRGPGSPAATSCSSWHPGDVHDPVPGDHHAAVQGAEGAAPNNSLLGLAIVYITFNLPFGLFIMRNSFAALPASLEEAALVDGCGILGAIRSVLLPVVMPGVITTALLTFFATWNEFFAALILHHRPGQVHPAGDPDPGLQRPVRHRQLGLAAGRASP